MRKQRDNWKVKTEARNKLGDNYEVKVPQERKPQKKKDKNNKIKWKFI